MAMIPCPECQRQVSDQAPSCPGCGHPLKAARSVDAQPVGRAGGIAQTVAPVVGKVASTYLIVLGVVAAVLFLGFFLLMGKVAGG